MPQATARRRWRLPRMKLATMLAFVAVAGGPAGWYIRAVRVQRQAVRALQDAGAVVTYDWEWDPSPLPLQDGSTLLLHQGRKELAGWRRIAADRFGPDAVASVASVSLLEPKGRPDPGATDEQIELIGRLKSLRGLWLAATTITEAGADRIAGLEQLRILEIYDPLGKSAPGLVLSRFDEGSPLEWLAIAGAAIDDEDCAAISRLSRLEILEIIGGRGEIGDAGLAKLAGLGRLKELKLSRTRITSEGLKLIGGMGSLESVMIDESSIDDLTPFLRLKMLKGLRLGDCRLGDEALSVLAEMPSLKSFSLRSNALTNAGLAHLRGSPALETLMLQSDSITAAGLESLGDIKTLKRIQIRGSKILPGSASEFARAHPGISVAY